MRPFFLLLAFAFFGQINADGQTAFSLDDCHEAARKNWPLVAQKAVFSKQAELQISSVNRLARRPQISALAQATLQNEVTKLPFDALPLPGFSVDPLSRDQYRLAVDASFLIFDGGSAKIQADLFRKNEAVESQKIEVELRKLREQIDLFFFQSLLADEGIALAESLRKDLETRLEKINGAVQNGTAIAAQADVFRAEILKIEQRLIELRASKKTFRAMLAELTGLEISEANLLIINELGQKSSGDIDFSARPEFSLFEKQKAAASAQIGLLDNKLKPRVSAFAQAGFGRPGFNFLNNDFAPFGLVGLRANWNFTPFFTRKNDRSLTGLQTQLIDNQRLTFEKSLKIQAVQQSAEVEKISELLARDPEIIALRERVKNVAAVQLENGTITAGDFLIEANAENQARLAERQRRVLLAFEKARLATIFSN